MEKRNKKINSLWAILWLFLLYIWFYSILGISSNNLAYKWASYIDNAFAKITVFENNFWDDAYVWWTDNSDVPDIEKNSWTSANYPNQSYKKVLVKYINEVTWAPAAITTSTTSISRWYFPPAAVSTHSH